MTKKLIIFIFLFSLLNSSFSQEKSKIAILDFLVAGLDKNYKEILMEQTHSAFINLNKYEVLETTKTKSLLSYNIKFTDEQGNVKEQFAKDILSYYDEQKRKSIYYANIAILGSIAQFGTNYSITIKGISVETEKLLFTITNIANNQSEIPNTIINLINNLPAYNVKSKSENIPTIEFNGTLYIYPTDNALNIQWAPNMYIETPTNANSTLNGINNTNLIVTKYGNGDYAAKICDELIAFGYDDWYLPSKEELTAIMDKIGGIVYWSSTENSANGAWFLDKYEALRSIVVNSKRKWDDKKINTFRCRCVRKE